MRDILRRKCHFCLAFCSVFVVVLSTLVVNTVIAKGPIIFLSLNQAGTGEFDAYFEPVDKADFLTFGRTRSGPNEFELSDIFFNYTHFRYLWGDRYNVAPRYHYGGEGPGFVKILDVVGLDGQFLNMWDTKLEKEIHLGS